MKKLLIGAAIGGMLLALPVTSAFAVEAVAGAGAGVNVSVSTGTEADVGAATTAMGSAKVQMDALGKVDMKKVKTIKIVKLDPSSANAEFTGSMTTHKAEIAALRGWVNGNADFKAQLDAQNVNIDSVIAADVAADGTVTLFTQG